MRYVFSIAYDGTRFAGAAAQVFGVPTRVTLAGRTDAGVHAAAQTAQADGETPVPAEKLAEVMSRLLPDDVKVLRSAAAPEGFDCTRAAGNKTYCYRFYCARTAHPLLSRYAARLETSPDLARMRAAARLLEGEHDFAAFRATGSSAKTTVRTVYEISVERPTVYGVPMYEVRVTGNGFLYNMVRILAGELYAVGCGIASERDIAQAFRTGDRTCLYKTLPAAGLTLERVDYGTDLFERHGGGV